MDNLVGRQKSEAHAPLEAAVAISAPEQFLGADARCFRWRRVIVGCQYHIQQGALFMLVMGFHGARDPTRQLYNGSSCITEI